MKPRPMHKAPRDGQEIQILHNGVWWMASYWDCEHLREDEVIHGLLVKGEAVNDAWRIKEDNGPGCIELNEAEGWLFPYEFPE